MPGGIERLNVIIGLQDKLSGRLGGVQKRLGAFARTSALGMGMATGGVLALTGALIPAIGHARELANLSTLGLDSAGLEAVDKAALAAARRFGSSATEIVASAYDIQSSIAGLSNQELADFTGIGAALAKGTKSSAATVTDYMGTMYGIFAQDAARMGKTAWLEATAGMTAESVRMFKTTGDKLAQSFSTLGADATAMGMSQAEQFATLGQLSATMGGGEAGGRLKALLRGVGAAQDATGLRLTDSAGAMLPLVDVLEKIRGKYGAIDTVAKSDAIKKAFGSDEAVSALKLLVPMTDDLRANTQALAKNPGLDAVMRMADKATTPVDRLTGAVKALYLQFTNGMLKSLNPMIEKMTAFTNQIGVWMDRFPYLTQLLGYATLAVFGLAIAGGLLMLAWAPIALVFSLAFAKFLLITAAIAGVVWVFDKLFDAWDALPGWVRWILRVLNPLILIFEAVRWAVGKAGEMLGLGPTAPSASDESARALAASKTLAEPVRAESSPALGEAARAAASGRGGSGRNVTFNVRAEKFDVHKAERMMAYEMMG